MSPRSLETYDVDEKGDFVCTFARDEDSFVYVNKRNLIGLWSNPDQRNVNNRDFAQKCENFDVEYSDTKFETPNSRGEYRDYDYVYLSSALCLVLKGSQMGILWVMIIGTRSI